MTEVDDATSLTSHQDSKDSRAHCQLPHCSLNLGMPILPSAASVLSPFPLVILLHGNCFIFPSELSDRSLLLTLNGNCPV